MPDIIITSQFILQASVAADGTLAIAYPANETQASMSARSFDTINLLSSGGRTYTGMTASYGSGSITLTNSSGYALPAGAYYVEFANPVEADDATDGRPLARYATDASGNTVLVGPDGLTHTINVALVFSDQSAKTTNAVRIQSALDAGGYVQLSGSGTAYIDRTMLIGDETTLDFGGVTLRLANGVNNNIIRNKHAQDIIEAYPSSTQTMVVSGGVATVIQGGVLRTVGEEVYLEASEGNLAVNGWHTITAASMGTWSFAVAGSQPTNISGMAIFVAPSNRFAGANLTRASNVVTVTEAGHKRHRGDYLYIGVGTLSDTSFAGMVEVLSVTPGVSWTYASTGSNGTPTGDCNLLGNYGIEIKNMQVDGNKANQSPIPYGSSANPAWAGVFGNASRIKMSIKSMRNFIGRGISCWNVADFKAPEGASESDCREIFQFDSHCDRVYLGPCYGYDVSDDVVAWGITGTNGDTYAGYLATRSPSGQGNMGTLTIEEIGGESDTSLLKMYCVNGYSLGTIKVGKITGNAPVVIGDSAYPSTRGGGFDELEIGTLNNIPKKRDGTTPQHQISLGGTTAGNSAWASGRRNVKIGEFVCNMVAGSTKNGIMIGSWLGKLQIDNWKQVDKTSTNYGMLLSAGGSISVLQINGGDGGNGSGGSFIKYSDAATNSITDLYLNNFNYLGQDAVNRYGTLIDNQIGGVLTNLNLNNVRVVNSARYYYLGGTTQTTNIFTNNLTLDNCQWGTYLNNPGANINVVFNGIRVANGIVNSVFGWAAGSGGTSTRIVGQGVECPANQFIYAGSGTYRFSLDCPERDAGWDYSGTYSAKNTPRVGDKMWNTGAGYGAGVGVYGYTNAGAWTKIF